MTDDIRKMITDRQPTEADGDWDRVTLTDSTQAAMTRIATAPRTSEQGQRITYIDGQPLLKALFTAGNIVHESWIDLGDGEVAFTTPMIPFQGLVPGDCVGIFCATDNQLVEIYGSFRIYSVLSVQSLPGNMMRINVIPLCKLGSPRTSEQGAAQEPVTAPPELSDEEVHQLIHARGNDERLYDTTRRIYQVGWNAAMAAKPEKPKFPAPTIIREDFC